ncbi:MAG TPA: protein kinase [Blastocatellia bacterium]|jgi:Tol biopolymer transport system component|nr:protein kinase [Blastocatellia bacterium]
MAITAGAHFNHYEIIAPLGAGGMGEVYRARDMRLNREVAIKALPASFAQDADRLRRFEQEARATSALNHPNILTVYDIGDHEGAPYIVAELLEGEELSELIKQGAIAPRKAVGYARQIAEGLAAAHAKGVVHRDLKPENLFITNDGRVKILDFGLAKLRPQQFGGIDKDAPTQKRITDPGVIMGTVGYMSPEQVRGQETDHRSDIFAFGVILYEMLTGQRAFHGDSAIEVMNAILKEDPPDFGETKERISPQLEMIVRRCLEKQPERRFYSAHDLAFALDALSSGSFGSSSPRLQTTAVLPAVTGRMGAARWLGRERLIWLAATVLLALTTLVAAWAYFSRQQAERAALRFTIVPPERATNYGRAVISPDGRNLIFTASSEGKSQIWLRPLDGFTAHPLSGTEGSFNYFWSPDSRSIGFFAGGKLKKIDVAGGTPQTLCNIGSNVNTGGGSWGSDGVILYVAADLMYRVPATGGEPIPVIGGEPATAPGGYRQNSPMVRPYFLPDGRHFLHYAKASQEPGIYLASLDGKEERRLLTADSDGIYAASASGDASKGWLLFLREGALLAQPFDARRLTLTGDPFPVADQVEPWSFFVSDTGILIYQSRRIDEVTQLGWIDRAGKPLESIGASGPYQNHPRLAPDGKRVVVARMDARTRRQDLYVIDLTRGTESRLTFDPADDTLPIWSHDGNRIVWASNRTGTYQIYQKLASGVGQDELLLQSDVPLLPSSCSSDGKFLLYGRSDPKSGDDLWALPLEGDRKPFPFLQTPFWDTDAQFSPDGRWIAYRTNESGRSEVYVQTFPASGGRWQVSTNGGHHPQWRGDGKELFYCSTDGKLMAVDVKRGDAFEAGLPKTLFNLAEAKVYYADYAATADGRRFLFVRKLQEGSPSPFSVVVNWTAEAPH